MEDRIENMLERVRIAEETALSELAAFGSYEPPEFGAAWEYPHVLRVGALAESTAAAFGSRE